MFKAFLDGLNSVMTAGGLGKALAMFAVVWVLLYVLTQYQDGKFSPVK